MERKLIHNVKRYGWQVQMVVDPEGDTSTFAYTIGVRETLRHAEIICFGLKPEVMHAVLNHVGRRIREQGELLENRDYDEFLESYPVRFKKVHPSHFPDYVGWAMWFNKYKPFDVLQLFWTDKEGRFPWEVGFNPAWVGIQPFLFEEKEKS